MMRLIWVGAISGAFLLSFAITILLTTPVCFMAGPGTAYPMLKQAVRAAPPGCTILLLPGTYRDNVVIQKPVKLITRSEVTFVIFTHRASGEPPFAVFAAPPRPVLIQAADPERPVIEIRAEGVELRGLIIRGGSEGIRVASTRNVRLIDNRISGSTRAGIALVGTSKSLLQGNEITGSPVGIALEGAERNRLIDNRVHQNERGIVLQNAHRNGLYRNRVYANRAEGIVLESSNQNGLYANRSERNGWGLFVLSSQGNALKGNQFNQNGRPLRIWGPRTEHFVHTIETSNTIDGRPIYYLVGKARLTIRPSRGRSPAFVALVRSEDITVEGLTLGQNVEGILLIETRRSRIRNNTLTNTLRGIYLLNSQGIEIAGNRVEGSEESGITLVSSHGNRLLRNRVLSNGKHGILLQNSQNVEVRENQITRNRESGVHLLASRKATLVGNQIQGNWVGVYLEQSGANEVKENWIRESQFGIFVFQSSGNRFLSNRLENNRHDTNGLPEEPPSPPPPPPPNPESGKPSAGGS